LRFQVAGQVIHRIPRRFKRLPGAVVNPHWISPASTCLSIVFNYLIFQMVTGCAFTTIPAPATSVATVSPSTGGAGNAAISIEMTGWAISPDGLVRQSGYQNQQNQKGQGSFH
jgi:hypothetical protein